MALGQGMGGIEGHHQPGLLHRPEGHALLLLQVRGVPGEDHVVLPVEEPRGQGVCGGAVKGQQHPPVPPVEAPHQNREVAALIAPDVAQPQRPAETRRRVVDPVGGLAHPLQDGLGLLEEDLPRRGQAHGPGAAVKELAAQALLQEPDLLGDGRLGQVELLRRLGEAPVLRRRHEVFQLIPVHGNPPRRRFRRNISFSYVIMWNKPL